MLCAMFGSPHLAAGISAEVRVHVILCSPLISNIRRVRRVLRSTSIGSASNCELLRHLSHFISELALTSCALARMDTGMHSDLCALKHERCVRVKRLCPVYHAGSLDCEQAIGLMRTGQRREFRSAIDQSSPTIVCCQHSRDSASHVVLGTTTELDAVRYALRWICTQRK